MNGKDKWNNYPLSKAVENKNIKIIKLLMEYADQHQINLELNERSQHGCFPLLKAFYHKNTEIVELITEYAIQHQIILNYNKISIGKNSEIIMILDKYEKKKKNEKKA